MRLPFDVFQYASIYDVQTTAKMGYSTNYRTADFSKLRLKGKMKRGKKKRGKK